MSIATIERPTTRENPGTAKVAGIDLTQFLDDITGCQPEDLADIYVRRSKPKEDLATLTKHAWDMVEAAHREDRKVRAVWWEQRSASKSYVRRDELEAAMAAVMEGHSKTLYVRKLDRFDRRGMGTVGSALDELDKRRARLRVVKEGLDSSVPGQRIIFAVLAERAREEAQDIAWRTQEGKDAHKALGEWQGGVVPYGLERDPNKKGRLRRRADEYPIAREKIAVPLLNGDSARTVAHRLNAEGIRTRNGKLWSATTVAKLAHSPLWAGLLPDRERIMDEHGNPTGRWRHTGRAYLDEKGRTVSVGQGVITKGERARIQAKLAARTRPGGGGKRAPEYLLTDTLRCGRCRGPMEGGGQVALGGRYHCRKWSREGKAGCLGVITRACRVDEAVTAMWWSHVSALEPGDAALDAIARRWVSIKDPEKDTRRKEIVAELDQVKARMEKLDHDHYVRGKLSEERYETLSEQQAKIRTELEAEQEELARDSDLSALLSDPETLREVWEASPQDERRELIRCALPRVTIAPAKGQGDKTPILERLTEGPRVPRTGMRLFTSGDDSQLHMFGVDFSRRAIADG
ncbi:recombinase family protein [Streptomyces blattellae]|uniref:recombinase family protein n=1 Tax=Streptomyces blattellae TaxID=2569855 RepID=UPI0018ACF9D8|nr:recombinase family protein [Streptomyces blattellae]